MGKQVTSSLSAQLEHHDASARADAVRRLARERPPGWIELCLGTALLDESAFPRGEAVAALDSGPSHEVASALIQNLALSRRAMRRRAASILRRLPTLLVVEHLRPTLEAGPLRARREAVDLLPRLPQPSSAEEQVVTDALLLAAGSPENTIRRRAVLLLGRHFADRPRVRERLRNVAEEDEPEIAAPAAEALARICVASADPTASSSATDALSEALRTEGETRRSALETLSLHPAPAEAFDALSLLAREENRDAASAIDALETMLSATFCPRRAEIRSLLLEAAHLRPGDHPCCADVALRSAWALARTFPEDALELRRSPDPVLRSAAAFAARRIPDCSVPRRELAADPDPAVSWLAGDHLPPPPPSASSPQPLKTRPPTRGSSRSRDPVGLPRHLGPIEGERRNMSMALAVLNPSYNINAGALIRTAEAAGADEFFLVGRPDYNIDSARGTDGFLRMRHVETERELMNTARSEGYQVVAIQQAPGSRPHDDEGLIYPPRPMFVLGNEDRGVSPWFCAAADLLLEIELVGAIDSLNVGCAGAVVLFEWLRRRRLAE